MLTPEQHQQFNEQGYAHIKGAFSKTSAKAMQALVWDTLAEKHGTDKADPSTWPKASVFKLQALKELAEFQAVGSEITLGVIDDLLGQNQWHRPKNWGQFLVTFPEQKMWTVPVGWHTDFDCLPKSRPTFGLIIFSFFGDVAPQGGGTAVVNGSHRLIRQFVESQPDHIRAKVKKCRTALLESHPWLITLSAEDKEADRVAQFMDKDQVIDGIPVRVAELAGEAGDIIVGHPWLLHCKAPNCGNWPRFMLVQRIKGIE